MNGQDVKSYTEMVWQLLVLISFALATDGSVDCVTRCEDKPPVVIQNEADDFCSVGMPDNPYRNGDPDKGSVLPCQIEIQSNCSNYCHIELIFEKFDLPQCEQNITNATDICDDVDSCEYILLHERGLTLTGEQVDEVTHFHGNHTQMTFESKTDKVLLHVCYRGETFSGRNIRIEYRSKDPTRKPPFYAGPLSVYLLCLFVVVLCGGVALIRWHPGIKRCLDPPPEKRSNDEEDV